MRKEKSIPKEDLDLINRSFQHDGDAQAIVKDSSGQKVKAGVKEVNRESFVLESFGGRRLIHQKSVVPIKGPQVIVGIAGQLWEDIPEALRNQVSWLESDFEQ